MYLDDTKRPANGTPERGPPRSRPAPDSVFQAPHPPSVLRRSRPGFITLNLSRGPFARAAIPPVRCTRRPARDPGERRQARSGPAPALTSEMTPAATAAGMMWCRQ